MEVEDFYNELVDFGSVYCGTKFTRVVKVQNKSTIDQIFTVKKYTDRPRLETGFSVKPAKSPPVRPNEEFTFTVQFVPNAVDVRSCDSFIIRHLYGVYCIIVTRAIVKGPRCSISCSQLQLVCPNDKKKVSKQFDLTNDGQCDADFQFSVDENPLISVQPQHGTISPSRCVHISVTYTPANNQCYLKRLFCLISNQEPLILDVHAMWLKSNEDLKPKIVRNDLPTYVSGYHCFFYDFMTHMSKEEVPLVSLDKSYIDFGHCQPKNSKHIEFSVTNNSNHKLSLVWHQGIFTKEFRIQSTEAEIDANDSITFSATFKPLVRDRLYGCVLEAQVFSSEGLVPVPVEINLKGDSFEELSCGWGAQYRVEPTSLVLPPCVSSPFCPSHATLTIHRKGHLPLAFCFHPPPLTNFCVKPQQGVIRGSFQIVIVQYQPKTLYEAVDTERWLLTFNSNENVNQCTVQFGCSIETPHMIINHGEDLHLPHVHPGTEYTLPVDIYNPTSFSFWFNAEVVGLESDDVLSVVGVGELWPHEHCRVPLVFRPRGTGELEVRVSCSPVLSDGVAGRTTSIAVTASCCETRLTVNPDKLLMKKVIRDFKHMRVIEVTNSGDSAIKSSFAWEPEDNCSTEDFEISFNPQTFFLKPGDSLDVEVTITPLKIGEKSLVIKYSTSSSCATPLLPVIVDSVFPMVQVTDIRTCNTAPLFTKMHYWKMMQINKFNNVLFNLRPRETLEVDMYLPSLVSTARPSTVELLVENDSELATFLTIRPLVSCSCPPVKRQVTFSASKLDHNCPHRCQVELEPSSVNVQAGSYAVLKMKISYKTVGDVESHFLLQFTPEDYEELGCSVKLRVGRTSIPKHTAFVDTTEPKENGDFVFIMRPVYIGDIKPFAQGFLLYNNTKQYVNFEVDDEKLHGTPFKYIGEKNQIPSLSNKNLLFTFLPYCCTTYQAEVTITVNNKHQKLILRGTGVCDPREIKEGGEYFPRVDKLNQINPSEVFFSTSHLNIGPIKPKTTLKDVFFINNNTKDIVSFMFLSSRMTDVVNLRVVPVKGLIQPGECVECHLSCHCCGWPSCLDITVACAHANFSQYAANIQALNHYYEELMCSLSHFTITEKGSETFNVTPPTENWPEKNYLTIGVTVDVRDLSVVVGDDMLPICPLVVEPQQDDALEIQEDIKLLITDVLERVLWQVLDESYHCSKAINDCSNVLYQQFKNLEIQTEIRVPYHVTQNILEDVLHSAWQDVFQLSGYRSCELFRRRLINQTTPELRVTNASGRSSSGIPTVASISDSFISMWSERFRVSSKKSISS